jgi:hypothetical protein
MFINDVSKEIDIAQEIRQACQIKKLYNLMLVPISAGDKLKGGSLLLLLNRYSSGEDSSNETTRKFISFNAYSVLCSNKMFQNLFAHCLYHFNLFKNMKEDHNTEDTVMGSTSLHEF